jgi:hypothetical protein
VRIGDTHEGKELNPFSSRSAEELLWNQEGGSTEIVHTTSLRRLDSSCFQQMSSERSHHRRVISADNAIQMEEMRNGDRVQVGRERVEDIR